MQQEQPEPHGEGVEIYKAVMEDIAARAVVGREKYGGYLKAFNGRNALVDAYQESLDLACYLRQAIIERDEVVNTLRDIANGRGNIQQKAKDMLERIGET